jgi:hypothetical protein
LVILGSIQILQKKKKRYIYFLKTSISSNDILRIYDWYYTSVL